MNLGGVAGVFPLLALPSAGIGALVGAIAGATGKLWRGALVGAILSGIVFELFMCACASLIGQFDDKGGGANFLAETAIWGLEMAIAGGVGGAMGGQTQSNEAGRRETGDGQ